MSSKTSPTIEFERSLTQSGARFVIGIDEVGRGAVAGPVAVGVALIDTQAANFAEIPDGLRDSKLLSERQREALQPLIATWMYTGSVGMVDASAIDEKGIVHSLALSASRGLTSLLEQAGVAGAIARDGAVILLDGTHNWLEGHTGGLPVTVRAKADRDCASVAAASVLAKVARDHLMVELAGEHPGYGFEGHKGYASELHIHAIRTLGPSAVHRKTWLTKILSAGVN
jgi:ribonuclease HII